MFRSDFRHPPGLARGHLDGYREPIFRNGRRNDTVRIHVGGRRCYSPPPCNVERITIVRERSLHRPALGVGGTLFVASLVCLGAALTFGAPVLAVVGITALALVLLGIVIVASIATAIACCKPKRI